MRRIITRFCLALAFSGLWLGTVQAFDAVSGGGDALITQTNVDNASKVVLSDLLLTTNTAVSSETVTITIPAGTGTLEFSTDALSITADTGNFTVTTPVITASSITFDITGSGTLRVQNLGLFNTNGAAFTEDRFLNVNFLAANFSSDFFRVDTRDFAVAFGGGQHLNTTHSSASSPLTLDSLRLVANSVLAAETVTITFDPASAFTTQATGSVNLAGAVDTIATTTLDSLTNFVDGNTITVTDSSSNTAQFTVTATNTVTDLETFFSSIAGLSASFDDPNDEIDLTADIDFTISSTGAMPTLALDADEAANLQFASTLPNFLVSSGTLSAANITLTANQLQFDLSGSGQLEIQNIQIFADNLAAKGEFFETRFLNVNAQATDIAADLLVVDTTDYSTKTTINGASGGSSNDIFIIGDALSFTFAPFDFSTRLSATTLDLSTFTGEVLADFNDPFTVVADDDDGSFNVAMTLSYAGTNVQHTTQTSALVIDNQAPVFDFTNHVFLELPTGKTVAGINDIVTLKMPPESTNDGVVFTADFSAIAGSVANFVRTPAADTSLVLQEVAVDNSAFDVAITFTDDAGNSSVTLNTNQIAVDLIRPVLSTASVLSITGSPVPGTIGDTVQVALPVDTTGSVGDTITYNIDLSALGGSSANLVGAAAATSFGVSAGSLNDASFNQTLTVFDKALNSTSALTNSLQIDNAVPTFDTTCGATFQVTDQGAADTNSVADVSNGAADQVFFLFPDKNIVGCDLDSFSVDLAALGSEAATITGQLDADGTGRTFTLQGGNLDLAGAQFPLTVFDVNGNSTSFLTGALNVDQKLTTASQIADDSFIISKKTPNGAVLVGGTILINTTIGEADVVSVSAEIPGAARATALTRNASGRWMGTLLIDPGLLTFEPKFIQYNIIDDAGNTVAQQGNKSFYITNDTTERGGGGGGSLSTNSVRNKATLQRFTPNQSKEFHDLNAAQKVKSKERLRLDSLRRRMTLPRGDTSRIQTKPLSLIEQQRAAWKARQAALAKDGTPKKLQKSLEKLVLPRTSEKSLAAARNQAGEFRLRSTLASLKSASQPKLSQLGSQRKVAPNHRGKWLEIKR